MNDFYVNETEVEMKARQLRAEALREMVVAAVARLRALFAHKGTQGVH